MNTSTREMLIAVIARSSKVCIFAIILSTLLVLPLATLLERHPTGEAKVVGELVLSPVLSTTSGYLLVQPRHEVTAVFTFTNPTGEVSLSRRIMAAGRGPEICALGWDRAPAASFSAVENVILQGNETQRYEEVRAFATPGVYRIETKRQTLDGSWEGFASSTDGKYIIVGDETDAQSFDTSCITPIPKNPPTSPSVTTSPTPPKAQSTATPQP